MFINIPFIILFLILFNFWVLGSQVDGTGTRDTGIGGNLDMTARDSSGGGGGEGGDESGGEGGDESGGECGGEGEDEGGDESGGEGGDESGGECAGSIVFIIFL